MHLNFDTSVGKGAKELQRQSRRNRESFLNEEGDTSNDSSNMNHEETQSSGRGVTTKGRKSFILQSVEMRERGKKGSRDTHGRHSDVELGGQGVTDASQGRHTITTHPSDKNEKENSSRTTRRSRRRVKLEKANLIESLEQQISVMRQLSSQPSKDHREHVHRSRNSSEDSGATASSHETTEEEEERESLEVSLRPENMRGPLPGARRALDPLAEEEEAESSKMSAVWRSSTGDDDDSDDDEGDDREQSLDVQLKTENMHADPSTRDSSVWEEQRKVVNPLQKGVRDFIPSRTSRLPRNPQGVDGGPPIRTRTSRLSRYSSTASMRESVRYSSTT